MSIAEGLYTDGYISYPRTETSLYPLHFDVSAVLKIHEKSPNWGKTAAFIRRRGANRPRASEGGKVSYMYMYICGVTYSNPYNPVNPDNPDNMTCICMDICVYICICIGYG